VHLQVVASPTESGLITTNPAQVAAQQAAAAGPAGEFDQPQGTIDLSNRLAPGSTNNL
jgi:hypothetical protein